MSSESGPIHIAAAMLLTVARVLGVTIEELIGMPAKRGPGKRGLAPKLQQQLERARSLPKAQQQAISKVLDSVLAAHQ